MGITRRDILAGVPGLVLGAVAGHSAAGALETPEEPKLKPFRFAHLTDFHVKPGRVPEKGVSDALIHAQERGAQLLINGGDTLFESAGTSRDEAEKQWRVFHRLVAENCSVELKSLIGNHDLQGWGTEQRKQDSKLYTLEQLGLKSGYYSLERGGWKIIVLDSIHWAPERPTGYFGQLGQEQYEWLSAELEQNTSPCCLISHIPILAACAYFDGPNEKPGFWLVPSEWMHLDARPIKNLLRKHPEVKLCLSGHIHLADRVDYLGVSYFCNGAVCGDYWRGNYQETPPCYALVDLFPDGTFQHQLIPYQAS